MKRLIAQNFGWKLLSVVLAFLLWLSIARDPELATSINVPILFRNIPDDMDTASDVPDRIRLEVRGPARRLTPESLAQTAVVLDLKDVQPGQRTFNIHDWNIRSLPAGVEFYRAVPSQVGMMFERLITKEVPIEPTYSTSAPDGYVVTAYSFDPAKVKIRGPENRVQNIDHVTTDPIDLSGIVSKAEKRIHIRLSDPQVRLESASIITFSVQLDKIPTKDNL